MIRIACSDSEASCLIASLITEIAMPCPCEGGPLRICGTGPDGAPAEVRILGGGVYEIEGPTAETVAIIFLDIAKTHGQIDNRACEFWTKRVLDVKYMTAAWRKKDAARFR